jgi:hypothetical protein
MINKKKKNLNSIFMYLEKIFINYNMNLFYFSIQFYSGIFISLSAPIFNSIFSIIII